MSRLFLAPMEGLADYVLRDVLTAQGGFDGCVSEFVRVTGSVLPQGVYGREAPEVLNGGRTPAGTPMVIQLLGSDPMWMALNAARAASVSPHGVDLNFGCPARIVNQHGGGAMLLAHPEQLNRIVSSVCAAVPSGIAVTAKMRLGVADTSLAIDCAVALAEGGASSLVVHARTREEGYRAPAHWEWIARIKAAVNVPVVANGEVWTVADWERCRAISGCADVMIGRGVVSDPFLPLRIRGLMDPTPNGEEWPAVLGQLSVYMRKLQAIARNRHEHGRLKKWLSYLKRTWPEAAELHSVIRNRQDSREILDVLEGAPAFDNPALAANA